MSTAPPEESIAPTISPAASEEGESFLTPPSSPKPDHYGSVSSPVSPAPETPPVASSKDGKPKRKPLLFRLSGKKKKQDDAAVLAPPSLGAGAGGQTPEPEINWLENKAKKTKSSRFFGKFRNSKTEKAGPSKAPKASWTKKKAEKPEPLAPKTAAKATPKEIPKTTPTPQKRGIFGKQQQEEKAMGTATSAAVATAAATTAAAVATGATTTPNSPTTSTTTDVKSTEQIDDIVVEETYVTEEDSSVVDASTSPRTTPVDPAALARRKAIIQDSWEFYRLICSLVCDRDRYLETFRTLQKDPVYPYLNSLTSVNDPGDVGYENFEKPVMQSDAEEYQSMSKLEVAQALEQKAHETLPQFVEVCKALAGSLGIAELGIGPIKGAATALRKAQRKYDGDLLKVTDYCRALIIVDDMAALLGLLELLRDSYGDLIRRVKLSTLNSERAKIGGYRDCIINIEIEDHICELQVHLRPMWEICKTKGYKHYQYCWEYKTDSFKDAYASLKGMDRQSLRELIAWAEEVTSPYPLDNVKGDQEKIIMDYFAMAGLYYKMGSYTFGEIYFSRLTDLRKETFGVLHPQTDFLQRYLVSCLKKQHKEKEANMKETEYALEKVKAQQTYKQQTDQATETAYKEAQAAEHQSEEIPAADTSASFWGTLSDSLQQGTDSAYALIMDPNRKVREEEEATKAKIKTSKQVWRSIRRERYPFLEGAMEEGEDQDDEEVREDVEEGDVAPEEEVSNEDTAAEETAAKAETTKVDEGVKKAPSKEEKLEVADPVEHVEEKKDDGAEPAVADKKTETTTEVSDKEIDREDSITSALNRLMEGACSLCSPSNSTKS